MSSEVYHGSPVGNIAQLEPRQARSGQSMDGMPAIHATSDIELAIFMALIGKNCWGGWDHRVFAERGFYLYEEQLDDLTAPQHVGFVYALSKDAFEPKEKGMDYVSFRPVIPLGVIAVSASDLPSDITTAPKQMIIEALSPYQT